MVDQHDSPEDQVASQESDEVDGCSCDFTDQDPSLDEDLPAAVGGIG
jgi:hypothetical protein